MLPVSPPQIREEEGVVVGKTGVVPEVRRLSWLS